MTSPRPLLEVLEEHVTQVRAQRAELPLAQRRVLEDVIDRGIDPRAILKRRHWTHIDPLVERGILTYTDRGADRGLELVDEVAALVALGRACGDHDRPLPCQECQ